MSVCSVQDPGRRLAQSERRARANGPAGMWTILEDRYVGGLDRVAQQIVLQGVDVALEGVPMGKFGALIDRGPAGDREPPQLTHARRRILPPAQPQTSPLHCGLRHPRLRKILWRDPSGHFFAARSNRELEFNLSQLESPRQLLDALHRVRDTALKGHISLVFWDEFDTALDNQPLGWLRHFLAPMQDGAFQEGQIVHPIGRAIFVFAGGTSESMATFDKGANDPAYRAAKGPDFVSRLKGYVDIVGPNPKGGDPERDRYYIIRRAILLRSLLQGNAPHIFRQRNGVSTPRMDSGLLRAFLEIPAYKHGARSMEAVVTTSSLSGMTRFERSALPSEAQLNLHVDGRQFLSLVQSLELSGDLLERLARAAHELYQARVQGRSEHAAAALPSYADLAEEIREQNRQAVRDIPGKLAYAGYVMRPARSDAPPFDFPAGDRETLAELEHNRWIKAGSPPGGAMGQKRTRRAEPMRPCCPGAPFRRKKASSSFPVKKLPLGEEGLPESEKQKDRDQIDGIPAILARAGYTLIKVREHDARE